jgi:23S rRNA maturation-related 3'-5' exoribonuclease YhaM
LIITLWLFQILNKYSYRETLEKAKDESFDVPSLCDYHYRVRQLDEKLQMFGSIKQKICSSFKLLREDLARKASIACVVLWNFYLLATYRVWLKCLG